MLKRRIIFIISLTLILGAPAGAQRRGRKARAQASAPSVPYIEGEANIVVLPQQHPVISIAMAPSGVTVIEFPVSDRFFAVHPPENGDWVQVEKSPSITSDHHLVLRAGKDLASTTGPAASISVQMRSGLLVTIWVYPVKAITKQTHRCVITYDRAEIVAARRRAGLAVDLGEAVGARTEEKAEDKPAPDLTAENREKVAPADPAAKTAAPEKSEKPEATPEPKDGERLPSVIADVEKSEGKKVFGDGDQKSQAKAALEAAQAKPKQFKKWTEPLHGLSVSAQGRDLDERRRIAVIAVKNAQSQPVRVLPGHPDLYIETLDQKEKTFQVTPIKKLYAESTATSRVIPPWTTVYYAIVYTAPILGVKQRLRVAVGQTNAADDPAGAGLTANQ